MYQETEEMYRDGSSWSRTQLNTELFRTEKVEWGKMISKWRRNLKKTALNGFVVFLDHSYPAITAGPVSLGRICTLQACCASPSCNFLKFGTRKYHFSWHMDESVLDTEINWIQLNKEIWIWVFTFTRPELVLVKMHTLRFY